MDREDMQRRCRCTPFKHRSYAECDAEVALDKWDVSYVYEARPLGMEHIPMTPDFTIEHADPALDLPRFVEIKDYDVITKCLAAFDLVHRNLDNGGPRSFPVTPDFWQRHVREDIARAQRLVNAYSTEWQEPWPQQMLITGHLNAGVKTAIILNANHVTFDRYHPAVSTRGLSNRRSTWLRAEQWEYRMQAEKRQREIDEREWEAKRVAENKAHYQRWINAAHEAITWFSQGLTNRRYDSTCEMCKAQVPRRYGHMVNPVVAEALGWVVICQPCYSALNQAA